jgi:hypothetical protein
MGVAVLDVMDSRYDFPSPLCEAPDLKTTGYNHCPSLDLHNNRVYVGRWNGPAGWNLSTNVSLLRPLDYPGSLMPAQPLIEEQGTQMGLQPQFLQPVHRANQKPPVIQNR